VAAAKLLTEGVKQFHYPRQLRGFGGGSNLTRSRAEFQFGGGQASSAPVPSSLQAEGVKQAHTGGERFSAEAKAMPEEVEQFETRTAFLCSIVAGNSQLLRLRSV
jgi:hypothetical protein